VWRAVAALERLCAWRAISRRIRSCFSVIPHIILR
jgi:hypothetical protein